MTRNKKKYLLLLSCFCLLGTAFGCAAVAPYRAHPEFEMRTKNIKTSGLLSPDIKIYELTAGGLRELRDDWCARGIENVQGALLECLGEKPLVVKPITVDKDLEQEMEEIYALYRAVSASINTHTYGEFKFPEKMKNFDYSIGSVEKILQRSEADALIFVNGFDEISTAGRKVLKTVGFIAALAVSTGGVYGPILVPRHGVYGPILVARPGITVISVALIDPSGNILWYNIKGSEGGYDLRKPESATKLVREILSEYPGARK